MELSTYAGSLDSLSPHEFGPNDGFMVDSFDSGYGYDSFQLEESLLSPPNPLDLSAKLQGGAPLSLTDCGKVLDSYPGELRS